MKKMKDKLMGAEREHTDQLTELKEQITRLNRQTSTLKSQVTRVRKEMRQTEEEKSVLRSALAVKTFELTELQSNQKEQIDRTEQLHTQQLDKIEKLKTAQIEHIEQLRNEQNEQITKRKKLITTQQHSAHTIAASTSLRQRNLNVWATPIKALLATKFASDAYEQRIATLRLCLEDEIDKRPAATRVQDDRDGAASDHTLTERRVFYALQKLTGDDVGRLRTLQMVLEVLPQSTLLEALPPMLVMGIVGRAEQDFASAIQAEYDISTCLNLKFKNLMSVRQWNRSRLLLGFFLNTDGEWERKKIGTTKISMPTLPEHRSLLSMQRDIEHEYGIRLDGAGDGSSCSVSLIKSLQADIDYNIKLGELVCTADGRVTTKRGETLHVQLKMDACRAMSKIQQTSIAYSFPNGCNSPNSPYSTTEVCIFEGDDHWDSVHLHASQTLAEMNALIADPVVKYDDGSEVQVDVFAGADLSNAGDMLCISSCNGPYPCPLCYTKREELNPLKKPATRAKRRTLAEIDLLSHTACGICPGCKMEIVATPADVKDPTKQMCKAQTGDEEPPTKAWSPHLKSLKVTWLVGHFGIKYGHHPLLRVELKKWIACLLHANLRVTSGIVNRCVFIHLGKYGKAEEQGKAIEALLAEAGVWIKEGAVKPKSKDLTAAYKKPISFVGRDAESINMLGVKMMDIVLPPATRAKNQLCRKEFEKAEACWAKWRELWRVLNDALDSTDEKARNARADVVQGLADEFRVRWYKAVGSTQGLYIHMLHEHFADMVREVGDLRPYQAQGLEHLHGFRKDVLRHLTNRQKKLSKYERNRVVQIMSVVLCRKVLHRRDSSGIEEKEYYRRAISKAKTVVKRVKKLLEEHGIVKQV
jgi:hypothetical protein